MTRTAKLTSKGQLTLPVDVRRAMNVTAGDLLEFEQDKKGFRIVPKRKTGRFEKYRGTVDFGIKGGREGIIRYVRKMRDGE